MVASGWSAAKELAAPHDSGSLKPAQALGKDVGDHARQARLKVGEALGTELQLAHDQQRPALTDQVEGVRRCAPVAATDVAGLPKHRLQCLGNRTRVRGKHEWRGAYLSWRLGCSMSSNHLEGRRLRLTLLPGLLG